MFYRAKYKDKNGTMIEVKSAQPLEAFIASVQKEMAEGTTAELWQDDQPQEQTELQKCENLAIANSEYIVGKELENALNELGV